MSDEINVDKVMDLKGMPCPMPGTGHSGHFHGSWVSYGFSCMGQNERERNPENRTNRRRVRILH